MLVTLHNQQVLGLIIKCGPDLKRNQGRSLVAVPAQADRREAVESYLRLMHIEVPVVIHHYLDFFVVVFAVWISHFRVFCFFATQTLLIGTHGEAIIVFHSDKKLLLSPALSSSVWTIRWKSFESGLPEAVGIFRHFDPSIFFLWPQAVLKGCLTKVCTLLYHSMMSFPVCGHCHSFLQNRLRYV